MYYKRDTVNPLHAGQDNSVNDDDYDDDEGGVDNSVDDYDDEDSTAGFDIESYEEFEKGPMP